MSTFQSDPTSLQSLFSLTKERIKQRQADRTLDKLYWKLGKEVVELVRAGEITHPGVNKSVDGIEIVLKDRAQE